MPMAHRMWDKRACSAGTIVQNQSTVFVNGRLWSIKGSVCTHEMGGLINSFRGVWIGAGNGKGNSMTVTKGGVQATLGPQIPVIVHTPDKANPNRRGHVYVTDETAEGSPNVWAYENKPGPQVQPPSPYTGGENIAASGTVTGPGSIVSSGTGESIAAAGAVSGLGSGMATTRASVVASGHVG